jgi:hypothetical protein
MATSHHSTLEPQLSRTPQVQNTTKKVIRLKLDSDLLEIIEQFGGATRTTIRERRDAQITGIKRALNLAALSFLNSEDQGGMVVDALRACMDLPAKIEERREIAELTKLYNLPDTEEETLAS